MQLILTDTQWKKIHQNAEGPAGEQPIIVTKINCETAQNDFFESQRATHTLPRTNAMFVRIWREKVSGLLLEKALRTRLILQELLASQLHHRLLHIFDTSDDAALLGTVCSYPVYYRLNNELQLVGTACQGVFQNAPTNMSDQQDQKFTHELLTFSYSVDRHKIDTFAKIFAANYLLGNPDTSHTENFLVQRMKQGRRSITRMAVFDFAMAGITESSLLESIQRCEEKCRTYRPHPSFMRPMQLADLVRTAPDGMNPRWVKLNKIILDLNVKKRSTALSEAEQSRLKSAKEAQSSLVPFDETQAYSFHVFFEGFNNAGTLMPELVEKMHQKYKQLCAEDLANIIHQVAQQTFQNINDHQSPLLLQKTKEQTMNYFTERMQSVQRILQVHQQAHKSVRGWMNIAMDKILKMSENHENIDVNTVYASPKSVGEVKSFAHIKVARVPKSTQAAGQHKSQRPPLSPRRNRGLGAH